jgi:hypothetical protein
VDTTRGGLKLSESKRYEVFGGVVDLQFAIRIPSSFYDAVKQYCKLTDTPVREWFNNEIILAIEALEVGYVTPTFLEKYHLRGLSRDKREAMIQAYRTFTLKEEKLSDE